MPRRIAFLCALGMFLCAPGVRAGTNPPYEVINAEIEKLAQVYEIPAEIMKAVVHCESGWNQFRPDGSYVRNPSSGATGLTQLTGSTKAQFDVPRTENDWQYNLECGFKVLDGKWNMSKRVEKSGFPDRDRRVIENWYYPLNYYGGDLSGGYFNYILKRLTDRPGILNKFIPADIPVTNPKTAIPGFKFGDYFVAQPNNVILGPDKTPIKIATHIGTIGSPQAAAQEAAIKSAVADAADAFAKGDLVGALKRASRVAKAPVPEPVKKPALDLIAKIEAKAQDEVARADGLAAQKNWPEALRAYDALADSFAGTEIAKAAQAKITALQRDPAILKAREEAVRLQESDDVLNRALNYESQKDWVSAYLGYRTLGETYPGTPAAAKAKEALDRMAQDPEQMNSVQVMVMEDEGQRLVTRARNYKKGKLWGKSLEIYREIINKYADSEFADEAREEIPKLEETLKGGQ